MRRNDDTPIDKSLFETICISVVTQSPYVTNDFTSTFAPSITSPSRDPVSGIIIMMMR